MPALATPLRRGLERAIVRARTVAETGAANSLIALGYADPNKPVGLSGDDAALRTALRARGRQLGEAQGEEGVARGRRALVEEIAYEQWHRMLFARFLAENGLLRHPEGATVSLEDCAELAGEEGARDAWDLAARYAAAMLPGALPSQRPGRPRPAGPRELRRAGGSGRGAARGGLHERRRAGLGLPVLAERAEEAGQRRGQVTRNEDWCGPSCRP